MEGLTSHDCITTGGGWVAVGGGTSVAGTCVGAVVGVKVGLLVGGMTVGAGVSVGVEVTVCAKVREAV